MAHFATSRIGRTVVSCALAGAMLGGASIGVGARGSSGTTTGTPHCSLSPATVGQTVTVTGTGFAPSTAYYLTLVWPDGSSAGVPISSNSSGSWTDQFSAYWSGTYKANVSGGRKGATLVTSCSETIA